MMFDLSGTRRPPKPWMASRSGRSYNTGEYLAVSFNEDNDALREAANEIIQEMKTGRDVDEAYQKYFDIEPPKAVLEKTNTPK